MNCRRYNILNRSLTTAFTPTGPQTTIYLQEASGGSGGNPTGYSQVFEQAVDSNHDGSIQYEELLDTQGRSYVLGLRVEAQSDVSAMWQGLLHDVHGSTRALVNLDGTIFAGGGTGGGAGAGGTGGRFDYDAHGNVLNFNPAAIATAILYTNQFYDAGAGQYHLRARSYRPDLGIFTSLDPYAGNMSDPLSLHKYLYTHGNPVMGIDPSGMMTLVELGINMAIGSVITYITAPIIKPAINYLANILLSIMPPIADTAAPSAWIFSLGVGTNINIPRVPLGISGALSYDRVASLSNNNSAHFITGQAQVSTRRAMGSLAVPVSIGFAWNLNNSDQYEKWSLGFSLPYKSLPSSWRSRIWTSLSNGMYNLLINSTTHNALIDFPDLQASHTSHLASRIAGLSSQITHALDRLVVSIFTNWPDFSFTAFAITVDANIFNSSSGSVIPSINMGYSYPIGPRMVSL